MVQFALDLSAFGRQHRRRHRERLGLVGGGFRCDLLGVDSVQLVSPRVGLQWRRNARRHFGPNPVRQRGSVRRFHCLRRRYDQYVDRRRHGVEDGRDVVRAVGDDRHDQCEQYRLGTLPAAVLPVKRIDLGRRPVGRNFAHQWINSISTTGIPALSQPTFSDISGTLSAAVLPIRAHRPWAASNRSRPSHSVDQLDSTTGVPALSQPTFSDISGAATLAQFPTIAGHTALANTTGGTAAPAGVTLISSDRRGDR